MLSNKKIKIDFIKPIFFTLITMVSFTTLAETKNSKLSENMDIEIYYETSSGLFGMTENGYYNFNTGDEVTFYLTDNKRIKILNLNKNLSNPNIRNTKDVVFEPLEKKLTNYVIQKTDKDGTLCFYDVSKYGIKNYTGPIGETYYKITTKGIYEYPSIGDKFVNCERVASTKQSVSFEPIDDFSRFEGGILSCALNGCSIIDLNGYSLTAYDVETSNEKYRSVAMHYDKESKILIEKSKGIGKQNGIPHLNLAEYLWLTPLREGGSNLIFNGLWRYSKTGQKDVNNGCILIKDKMVFESSEENPNCINPIESYTVNISSQYIDMWWLKNEGATATIAQINAAVKYKDQNNITQYTGWEYFPISESLESAPIYKYSYNPAEISNGKKEVLFITTFERVK
ncbi:MAG: hypothetical protein ABJN96_16400 [Marinomonas sp.]